MTDLPDDRPAPALSFGAVAGAYDRARPSYPAEAVAWLAGSPPRPVLELGAGTGKLTEPLVAAGHRVLATDPLGPMLHRLAERLPGVPAARARAERIPLRSRSVDLVVAGQAFHWFDLDLALPEIARVLRPGGHIALAWNVRDESVPWVRRLGRLIGSAEHLTDPTQALLASTLFGYVDSATFRFWQPLDRGRLRDLVSSRSRLATASDAERRRVLAGVDELYDSYGRGADGMLLPYVTHCYRAVVHPLPDDDQEPDSGPSDGSDTDALLIDFS